MEYCIACKISDTTYGQDIKFHYGWDEYEGLFVCEGPFTSCPPPDNFDDDWDVNLVEPDQDELDEMNRQADLLRLEMES